MARRLNWSTHWNPETGKGEPPANLGGASGPDSMMTQDLGDTDSGKQFFPCGHENPGGNRYCNICGEVRGRRCPLCSTLNRGHAKFCGTCGARLLDEGTASETAVASPTPQRSQVRGTPVTPRTTAAAEKEWASELGPDNPLLDSEEPPWAGRSGWRRNAFLASPIDDMTEEDEPEAKDRRRRAFLLAGLAVTFAVTIAIVLGVEQFSPTRSGGFLERARGWVAADRDSASATRGAPPPAPEGTDASAASSARESKTAAPRAATSESAQEAAEVPRAPRAAEVPATSASLPSRSASARPEAPEGEAPTRGAARALAPAPQSSEERMADFLIEQLGPEPAAEKALSTAAWYDAGRSEHAFWERVAEAIRRRTGS
jgi:double zinc ribbon protein